MIGLLWNIRGLGKLGRDTALASRIRDFHVDFLGIMETKKNNCTGAFLKALGGRMPFVWHHLEAKGAAGGILVGANSDSFNMVVGDVLKYSVSVMLSSKSNGFS